MLSPEKITSSRHRLLALKKDLEGEIGKLEIVPKFGTDTDHFEEKTEETEEYSKNIGMEQAFKERLANVSSAIQKIGEGTYGICESCEKAIEWEVLEVDPESRYCKECKAGQT